MSWFSRGKARETCDKNANAASLDSARLPLLTTAICPNEFERLEPAPEFTFAPGITQEIGSARFQRAAIGILAGRRAKAAGSASGGFQSATRGSFRQDSGKGTLEAYAPDFLSAATDLREFESGDGRGRQRSLAAF